MISKIQRRLFSHDDRCLGIFSRWCGAAGIARDFSGFAGRVSNPLQHTAVVHLQRADPQPGVAIEREHTPPTPAIPRRLPHSRLVIRPSSHRKGRTLIISRDRESLQRNPPPIPPTPKRQAVHKPVPIAAPTRAYSFYMQHQHQQARHPAIHTALTLQEITAAWQLLTLEEQKAYRRASPTTAGPLTLTPSSGIASSNNNQHPQLVDVMTPQLASAAVSYPRRPSNSFQHFMEELRSGRLPIQQYIPSTAFAVSRIASRIWAGMSVEQKRPHQEAVEEARHAWLRGRTVIDSQLRVTGHAGLPRLRSAKALKNEPILRARRARTTLDPHLEQSQPELAAAIRAHPRRAPYALNVFAQAHALSLGEVSDTPAMFRMSGAAYKSAVSKWKLMSPAQQQPWEEKGLVARQRWREEQAQLDARLKAAGLPPFSWNRKIYVPRTLKRYTPVTEPALLQAIAECPRQPPTHQNMFYRDFARSLGYRDAQQLKHSVQDGMDTNKGLQQPSHKKPSLASKKGARQAKHGLPDSLGAEQENQELRHRESNLGVDESAQPLRHGEFAVRAAARWKAMSAEERKPYLDKREEAMRVWRERKEEIEAQLRAGGHATLHVQSLSMKPTPSYEYVQERLASLHRQNPSERLRILIEQVEVGSRVLQPEQHEPFRKVGLWLGHAHHSGVNTVYTILMKIMRGMKPARSLAALKASL